MIIQKILIHQVMQILPMLTPFIKYLKFHIINITTNLIRKAFTYWAPIKLTMADISFLKSNFHLQAPVLSLATNTDKCLLKETTQAHFVHFEENVCQIPTYSLSVPLSNKIWYYMGRKAASSACNLITPLLSLEKNVFLWYKSEGLCVYFPFLHRE